MTEPQPPNVTEGADPPDALPANAEDRKAAAAMSSLDDKPDDAAPKKEVDLKALNDAMKALGGGQETKKATPSAANAKKEEDTKKLMKVDAGDVAMMAEQLDVSKGKATELLRAHDANAIKAMTAFVTVSV